MKLEMSWFACEDEQLAVDGRCALICTRKVAACYRRSCFNERAATKKLNSAFNNETRMSNEYEE